jgi:hypothetical protein
MKILKWGVYLAFEEILVFEVPYIKKGGILKTLFGWTPHACAAQIRFGLRSMSMAIKLYVLYLVRSRVRRDIFNRHLDPFDEQMDDLLDEHDEFAVDDQEDQIGDIE